MSISEVKNNYGNYKRIKKVADRSYQKVMDAKLKITDGLLNRSKVEISCFNYRWFEDDVFQDDDCKNMKIENSDFANLCGDCPCFQNRLRYEIYLGEYKRVSEKQNVAKQILMQSIKGLFGKTK